MSRENKIDKHKRLLQEASLEDWHYLIKNSFVNGIRQYNAARVLLQGTYRESCYNLYFISAEELFKCNELLKVIKRKETNRELPESKLEELSQLFVHHIFKIGGIQETAIKRIKNTPLRVIRMDKPHSDEVEEGKKFRKTQIENLEQYSPKQLFHIKNESIYVGYGEDSDELVNSIDNFTFKKLSIMQDCIIEMRNKCEKKVVTLFGKEEINRLINYKFYINSKHFS